MNTKVPLADNPKDAVEQMRAYIELVKILRAECPWDREQTHKSIAHLLIEEGYELYDAIIKNDLLDIKKELGDLLLHIIMQSLIAEEAGEFTIAEMIATANEKMVKRHPHIFGEIEVSGTKDVLQNWEQIKMSEGRKSVFDGVPKELPSLLKAERLQEKAAKVGFDWDNKKDVWLKIEEEINELKIEIEKGNKDKIEDELGDVIFAIVNAARFEGVVAEDALQKTNNKFIRRFQYIENKAKKLGLKLKNMTLEEMDKMWDEAKKLE